MTETETSAAASERDRGAAVGSFAGLEGVLGVIVEGRTIASIDVRDGRATLGPAGAGRPRATVHCRSVETFQRVIRGEENLIVGALRGELALHDDAEFAIRALRELQAGAPIQSVGQGG
jgi:hypothetical protein